MEVRNRIKELKWVRARELLPNRKNWHRHPKAQLKALRGVLEEIGYADALLARELPDGRLEIVDGHARAETTPDTRVPVLILDVTEEEADKILLTLDPLAAMAESDTHKVNALLATVHSYNPGVQELLRRIADQHSQEQVRPEDVEEVQVSPDRVAELRAKWNVQTGHVWQAEGHRIGCGDCTLPDFVARIWTESGRRVRMISTDPPYGIRYADKNAYLNKTDRGNRIQRPIHNDDLTAKEIGLLFEAGLLAAIPHCERGATCYATVPSGPLLINFIQAFNAAGFEFKHLLVWIKQQFVIGMADYHHRHEPILYGWLPTGPHYYCGDRSQDSVFEVDKPRVNDLHPTCKPLELVSRMIANSSRVGELIYDPFAGSGSSIVAANQLCRVGYGCEIDPGYVAVILERLFMLNLKPELINK